MEVAATPARPGPRRSLSLDKVVGAALELLDEDGRTTPSLRRVAARLGVRPNTLYTYVPDGLALERAIVDHLLAAADPGRLAHAERGETGGRGETGQIGEPRAHSAPADWRRKIEDYASALRTVLLRRPAAVPLFFTAPMDGPHALEVGESLLALLTAAGAEPEVASRATYSVIVHVLGSVALTVADLPDPPATEQDAVELRRRQLARLDAEVWPLTAATSDVAATWNTSEQFRWGLARLLEGLVTAKAAQGQPT